MNDFKFTMYATAFSSNNLKLPLKLQTFNEEIFLFLSINKNKQVDQKNQISLTRYMKKCLKTKTVSWLRWKSFTIPISGAHPTTTDGHVTDYLDNLVYGIHHMH